MCSLESHLVAQIERSKDFFWHRLRWELVSNLLPVDSPFTLLDVGAGAGLLGEFMHRDRPAANYLFIEPIPSLEDHLAGRFGRDHNARERTSLPEVGFITLLDVLEHVVDDGELLAELIKKCEPGTTFVITVPALPRLWSQWDELLGHHRRYTRSSLEHLLGALPLDTIEVSYLMPELLPAAYWRRLRSKRNHSSEPSETAAEFPELPKALNATLYAIGKRSLRLRRRWPGGTSLIAIARRRSS